ncbi:cyanophycin metabolism-associated DUF1854 family protein [Tuwongella immobilis]|uniref:DUF1854 domain-containing protein n=1 Tax=Tuwongella immobilis TaxID=692036 RepID=A0A6C2YN76_9BACT|nr:DUF1854 domain-containing protein [Tuwongella immobilis]VIP02834.1 Uncharacterized protein OS=Methyloversatilis universalis (strain ATCC BAA-1314 / JCM 13912 / FAM5) GN=METUNv1_02695 PE=4 SV=1: DUF1854 [Tuwongella immobilis]VTS02590.1 Uncharacterized protein OS=Methyloversatilis universalis (strain ATCC BAA-1314 / JCM 13912 / FAM5) GN=METUNv1_02695 PE=4 SV=1: DUF1854 [Tuwongella immobilis]
MAEMRMLTDERGKLILILPDGTEHRGVHVIRAFPITAPREGIAIVSNDGREVAWIANLDQVDAAFRESLEAVFRGREFMPIISKIERINGTTEPTTWEVITDRGWTKFTLNNEDDVHAFDGNGAMILDAHGIRYRILDIRQLDGKSRRLLERYL